MFRLVIIPLVLFLVIPVIFLGAQSNEVLDTFLDRPEADLATSVWLVLLAGEQIPPDADIVDAMDHFKETPTADKIADLAANRPIEYAEFAYIAMEVMDLPAGMMYAIFPSPRYAAREFQYRGWMPGRPKPGAPLTPWEVTTSLSEVITWKEASK